MNSWRSNVKIYWLWIRICLTVQEKKSISFLNFYQFPQYWDQIDLISTHTRTRQKYFERISKMLLLWRKKNCFFSQNFMNHMNFIGDFKTFAMFSALRKMGQHFSYFRRIGVWHYITGLFLIIFWEEIYISTKF